MISRTTKPVQIPSPMDIYTPKSCAGTSPDGFSEQEEELSPRWSDLEDSEQPQKLGLDELVQELEEQMATGGSKDSARVVTLIESFSGEG
jgi:hypothetical protein